MDYTFLALAQLYEEFRQEIIASVEALGGKIEDLSPTDLCGRIVIDPKLQSYAEECIADALIRYNKRKNAILNNDAFIGVKILLANSDN